MHNNPNMDRESPPLDAEDWQIVFAAYADYPILAFILAQHLHSVRELIRGTPENIAEAIAGLDRAIEVLMPHTIFRDAGRKVYLLAVAGTLSTEQEDKLREIGLLE
ncbi:MAG TPA: hypothetical protein VN843_03360 [Anaerolineales bacterium]|nr:hypothetical protein [Anaerolineales bacterium]